MKSVISWVSMLMLLLVAPGTMAADEDVVKMVKSTADKVLQRFNSRESDLKAHPERIHDAIADVIKPHFDFDAMTQSAMGKYWRTASASEKTEVAAVFGELLIRTYGSALLNYSGKPIEYGEAKRSKDNARILIPSSVTASSGSVVPIDYILHQVNSKWKVSDVKIEGISLSANYRTSFASEIRKSGIAGLIAKLKERNKSLGG